MKNRIFLLLSAVILMGAPCAQENHDDHHECPPAATPDAGDLQTLCQEQFPAPDAGACPECDVCGEAPTMGVHEPGMVHNLVLGHLVDWAETADIKRGDPDDA
ncbi:MAG TPA: hypothetical protein DEB46_08910, partial [Myxococcales bacterium]|nr:hypothetical protein [Myxococcales bacterium]